MNIYGGEVKAEGTGNSPDGYGITCDDSNTSVTVYGGKLRAECANNKALYSYITLTKGAGYDGTIRYSSDKTYWSGSAFDDAKYVKVEKSEGGGD